MELSGKLLKILPLQKGQSQNGEWKKQEFVIQVDGPYAKKVCFTIWNNKVDISQFREQQQIKVSFDAESREYNGKWYTDLIAWRVQAIEQPINTNTDNDAIINNLPDANADDSTDDFPF